MIDFIINEWAGDGKAEAAKATAEKILAKSGMPYRFHSAKESGARELAARLTSDGEQKTLVAVGGDGTVHEVLNGIVDFEKTVFGVIPAGTGNDFAATLGVPEKPDEAVGVILNGKIAPVDFFDCSGVRGANIVGLGIDVDILRHYATKKRKGKAQYFLSLLHCLAHFKPKKLQVSFDGGEAEEKNAFIVCVCNGRQFGGGIRICPSADPFDGVLDSVNVTDLKRIKFPGALIKLAGGKIAKLKQCEVRPVRRITVPGLNPVEIDGEIYENLPFDVKVVSGLLRMRVPR